MTPTGFDGCALKHPFSYCTVIVPDWAHRVGDCRAIATTVSKG